MLDFVTYHLPHQVSEDGSCVAVQMHNLQHKFLRFSLSKQKKQHTPYIAINIRVSLIQAAMFHHHRDAADRHDIVSRLIGLALVNLKEVAEIVKLSRALSARRVDLNSQAAKHRGESLAQTQTLTLIKTRLDLTINLIPPCNQR